MEKLKGIRKLYHNGNGQGTSYRGRMNSWTFHEIQRQIEYKAKWEDIPIEHVKPRGTSRKCPECDSSLIRLEGRRLMFPSCKKTEDRDVIASRNIMAASVWAARSSRGSREGESKEDGRREEGNPPSRWMKVSLGHEPATRQSPQSFLLRSVNQVPNLRKEIALCEILHFSLRDISASVWSIPSGAKMGSNPNPSDPAGLVTIQP
jgi:hypothetical protein